MERRLAAILAADVAGYSRLMEADEAGTLAVLQAHLKELIAPKIAEHRGRIVKTTGDGLLAEFASVVDAVGCAAAVQRAMAGRNADVPADRRLEFRIGVNHGDIIAEGDDIYGEGVNVAARLEALADPGGVLVSGDAYRQVRNKLGLDFDDLGEQTLKNMAGAVRLYAVRLAAAVDSAGALPLPAKPSVAVLPFDNLSGDPEQRYFSDGITDDIITELSRFRELFVIARNSSFQYRDKATDVKRIGRELGVQYVVEGSVRKAGNRVRITAQLVDAGTGNHLWAERYDRDMGEIFAVQDEVTRAIVAATAGRLQADGLEKSRRKSTANLASYDYMLRGLAHFHRFGADDLEPARRMFEKAVELDPGFARAHAHLALMLLHIYGKEEAHRPPQERAMLNRAFEIAQRAVQLDDNDGICHSFLGQICLSRKSFDHAEQHTEKSIRLNPNDANLIAFQALFCAFVGRPADALDRVDMALRLNPSPPNWYWAFRGLALYGLRRYAEAAAALERQTARPYWDHCWLAACYAQSGHAAEARAHAAEALKMSPGFTLRRYAATEWFKDPAALDHLIEGMRKAGLPE